MSTPNPTSPETRVRIERVVSSARLFLSIGLLAAFAIAAAAQRPSPTGYALVSAYVVFAAVVAVIVGVAPRHVLAADVVIHLLDVLWAAAMTALITGSNSPFLIFFALPLFAASARWGLAPALATGMVAVALFIALPPLGPADASLAVTSMRVVLGTSPLVVASMLGFLVAQERTFRGDTETTCRVLSAITGDVPFTDSVRTFMDECLTQAHSSHAVLAIEVFSTQGVYLWEARRPAGARRTTLVLEDVAPVEKQIYFAAPSREVVAWHVGRTRKGRLRARGLGPGPFDVPARIDGAFAAPMLHCHGIHSMLAVDASAAGEWRARLMLLAPMRSDPNAMYLLRSLAPRAGSALYHKYLVRRVRSRAGATARARLARELHDGLLQALIGLEMDIDVLRRQSTAGPVPEPRLRQVQDLLRQNIADVRDSMLQLRVTEMTGTDVLRVIAVLVDRLRRETGIEVHLVSGLSDIDCAPRTCKHLARIVQEALSNVRKHSGARSVSLTLTQSDHAGRLVIEDDGRGFRFRGRLTLEQLEASDLGPGVIKERVRAIGGRLSIESRPGSGARMELEWPRRVSSE